MRPFPFPRYEPQRRETLGEFHATTVPMWIFDRRTLAILEVNEAATELYGYSRSEFLRMTILDIRPLEDIPKVLQTAFRAPGHDAGNHTWRHRKKDGTVFQANIMGWDISFDGRAAELVLAEPAKAASA